MKIGTKYKNKLARGVEFLCVGSTKLKGKRYVTSEKRMVVLSTGKFVAGPKKHGIKDFWKNFEEIA